MLFGVAPRGPMAGARFAFAALLGGVIAAAFAPAAQAGANSVLIVDASNSMNSPFDSGSRLEALKAALGQTIPSSASALDLGLVVFGHRDAQNCNDVEVKIRPAAGAASGIPSAVQTIAAQGVSSLAQSLDAAARAVDYDERAATIIAVADNAGVENCRVDTCATAERLRKDSVDLVIHLVAVDAKDDEIADLQCIAAVTGGRFVNVSGRSSLASALTDAFALAAAQEQAEVIRPIEPPRPKPVPPTALADNSPRTKPDAANDGSEGDAFSPGEIDAEGAQGEAVSAAQSGDGVDNVSVFAPSAPSAAAGAPDGGGESVLAPGGSPTPGDPPTDAASRPPADAEGDADIADVTPGLEGPGARVASVEPRAAVDAATSDELVASEMASPAPETTAAAEGGQESAAADTGESAAPPAAAEPAAPGHIRLAALIIAGTKPVPSGMEWQILPADGADTPGAPVAQSLDAAPELEVPSGEYVVRGTFGHATRTARATVTPDEPANVELVLDAGGLQIEPVNAGIEDPGADVLNTIYAAGTTSSPIARDVPSGQVVYLNAGVYRIESRYGNANAIANADIEVQPGKLVKAKINHRAGPASFLLITEGSETPPDDATWQILASDGSVVTEIQGAAPRTILAEGNYEVVVQHAGRTYRSTFAVKPGEETSVEVAAQ